MGKLKRAKRQSSRSFINEYGNVSFFVHFHVLKKDTSLQKYKKRRILQASAL